MDLQVLGHLLADQHLEVPGHLLVDLVVDGHALA